MVRFALVQLASTPSKEKNLEKALNIISALPDDVDIAVFPEYMMGYPEGELTPAFVKGLAEPLEGRFLSALRDAAKEKGVWLLVNFFEEGERKPRNTNVIIDDNGRVVDRYSKVHLFDIYGYRESDIFEPGSKVVTFGLKGVVLGVATCFDVRFPELFRAMALKGAVAFLLPSAWYAGPYKEEQWFIMGKARAHENVAFMIAVGNAARPFIGRSFVSDPYGVARLDLGRREKVGLFEMDEKEIEEARKSLPLLALRRADAYL